MIKNNAESSICPSCGIDLISAEEAAEIMGVSYARVRAILANNSERLNAIKIGKTWIIPENSARNFKPMPSHRPAKKQ